MRILLTNLLTFVPLYVYDINNPIFEKLDVCNADHSGCAV
jgi:hypothetical protein